MGVKSINIGDKRVHLTAYCPVDVVGLIACEFVLERAAELLNNTSADELRAWAIARDAGYAELFRLIDKGFTLPQGDDYSVDPKNAAAETRIVSHLLKERAVQCKMRS